MVVFSLLVEVVRMREAERGLIFDVLAALLRRKDEFVMEININA